MREAINSWVIFFKEDLKISDTCKLAREGLIAQITNDKMISQELIAYFKDMPIPYEIKTTDPSQVAVLKKIINGLYTTEEILSSIETIDIRQDRYTAGISVDAIKLGYHAVHAFYGALQLLNHSSADVQRIVGPHFTLLSQKMGIAAKSLEQFTPDKLEESTGAALASAIQMLPTQPREKNKVLAEVSDLIYELPHYFGQLQACIATHASTMIPNPHQSGAEHNAAVAQKKIDMVASFEQLIQASGLSIRVNNLSIMSKLVRHSADLLYTVAPLSQQAYLESVSILDEIRHHLVPELISELEHIEESLCLKSGVLTDSVIQAVDAYYTQLATHVYSLDTVTKLGSVGGILKTVADQAVAGAGYVLSELVARPVAMIASKCLNVITHQTMTSATGFLNGVADNNVPDIPPLLILQDDGYRQKMEENRHLRLREASIAAEDRTAEFAAMHFFDTLATYNTWLNSNLGSISQFKKNELKNEYMKFQRHLAAIYPDIDKLIVLALNLKPGEQMQPNSHVEYQGLFRKNHFTAVNGCRDRVIDDIRQSQAQGQFKARLVKNTIMHAGGTIPLQDTSKTNTVAQAESNPPSPLVQMGAAFEKKSMFGQISELKLSKTIDAFIHAKFLPYLKNNLSDSVLKELSLDDLSFTAATPPFIDFYKDAQGVIVYKQLITSLYYLKSGLEKLEQINDYGDPSDIVNRSRFLIKTVQGLALDIYSAEYYLAHAACNPELKALINESLDLLKPLRSIPLVGDYFVMPNQVAPEALDEIDVAHAWRAQQQLKASILTPSAVEPVVVNAAAPIHPDQSVVATKEENKDVNYLQLLAEQLYSLPGRIHQLRPDSDDKEKLGSEEEMAQKIQSFVEGIAGLHIRKETFQDLLKIIMELDNQIAQIGMESHALAISRLKEIRSELGAEIFVASDNAEFHLSLKPDSLSNEMQRRFSAFYDALITNLPLDEEQRFKLLIDDSVSKRRLRYEMERLDSIQANLTAQKIDDDIFGVFIENENSEVTDELGALDQLKMLHGTDFRLNGTDVIDKELADKFLIAYQRLQPHLVQIDWNYDLKYFLRNLTTPDDFESARDGILLLEDKLVDLVEGCYKTKTLQENLCQERIAHIKKIMEQEKKLECQKYQLFKDDMLHACLKAFVKKDVGEDLGDFSDAFSNRVAQDNLSKYQDRIKPIPVESLDDVDGVRSQMNKIFEDDRPELTREHGKIKTQCIYFNKVLQWVKEERRSTDTINYKINPLIEEKMAFLQVEQERVFPANIADQQLGASILMGVIERAPDLDLLYEEIKHFNMIIKAYDHLQSMKTHIEQKNSGQDLTGNISIKEIEQLQATLRDTSIPVKQRLTEVKARIIQPECSHNLLANADGFIKSLFRKLMACFGFESDHRKHFKQLKQTIHDFKAEEIKTSEHPQDPPIQEDRTLGG